MDAIKKKGLFGNINNSIKNYNLVWKHKYWYIKKKK